MTPLRRIEPTELERAASAVPPETIAAAARILDEVRAEGTPGLRRYAERLDGLAPDAPLVLDRAVLLRALVERPAAERALLERVAARVESFARAQRDTLAPLDHPVEGGRAGHTWEPIERAGCYVPGGRYPLPSTALMTALVARAAGVREVWIASPSPHPVTLAAAAVAGADAVLCAGGVQAIAALAYGVEPAPRVDLICGPGNRWVTAAKKLVYGDVGIDMLAGPSELVVLADDTADPGLVAADLLAQAEHDPDARTFLVTTSPELLAATEAALEAQLADLPTADIARRALAGGGAVLCADLDEACNACDRLAPEHLEVLTRDPANLAPRLRHAGALFLGPGSAEVLGDYGAGPNHVLPTGGASRYTAGLSVFTFLRPRTWLHTQDPTQAATDAQALARLEGLEAHARAAEVRVGGRC
ncbi:MAG: histidinol dehydrogenase [Planctomycetota bacterium]